MDNKRQRRERIKEERRRKVTDDRHFLLGWLKQNPRVVTFFAREAWASASMKEVAK